jgi:HAD superfamily hydrolase (TIGR01484 family)
MEIRRHIDQYAEIYYKYRDLRVRASHNAVRRLGNAGKRELMLDISSIGEAEAGAIRFVLMDIDDTLTERGKLLASSYEALWDLKAAGLAVVPVTGRPAGWCDLIARQWPVDGVVGENGALAFWESEGQRLKQIFSPNAVPNEAPALAKVRERALREVPGCRIAKDQHYRRFDLAIDFAEEEPVLPLEAGMAIKRICDEEGVRAKISSIHVNAWMGEYDKLSTAIRYLGERFGYDDERDLASVLFVGDSPNDEPMFAHFPTSCGVANVREYLGIMRHRPAFVSRLAGGEGFAEVAAAILAARGRARADAVGPQRAADGRRDRSAED